MLTHARRRRIHLFAVKALEVAQHRLSKFNRLQLAVLPRRRPALRLRLLSGQTKPRIYPLAETCVYLISATKQNCRKRRIAAKVHRAACTDKQEPRRRFIRHSSDLPEDTDVFHDLTQESPRSEMVPVPPTPYNVDGRSIMIEKRANNAASFFSFAVFRRCPYVESASEIAGKREVASRIVPIVPARMR